MQGWRSPASSDCIKTAPAARREASVMRVKGHVTSGMQSTGEEEKIDFNVSKAVCWDSVQDQG